MGAAITCAHHGAHDVPGRTTLPNANCACSLPKYRTASREFQYGSQFSKTFKKQDAVLSTPN